MKMIESSKKKIAPEIHLMTKQNELICLVSFVFIMVNSFKFRLFLTLQRAKDLEEVQAWKSALVEAKRSSHSSTSVR